MTRHCDAWLLPLLEGTVDSPSWAVTQSRKPHILAAISNCSLVKESLPFTARAKCRAEQFSETHAPVNSHSCADLDCGQPFGPTTVLATAWMPQTSFWKVFKRFLPRRSLTVPPRLHPPPPTAAGLRPGWRRWFGCHRQAAHRNPSCAPRRAHAAPFDLRAAIVLAVPVPPAERNPPCAMRAHAATADERRRRAQVRSHGPCHDATCATVMWEWAPPQPRRASVAVGDAPRRQVASPVARVPRATRAPWRDAPTHPTALDRNRAG